MGWLKIQKCVLWQSGGLKSETEVSQGWLLLRAVGTLCPRPQMQLLDVRCGRQMFFLKPAVSLNLFIAVSLLLAPQALPAHCTS